MRRSDDPHTQPATAREPRAPAAALGRLDRYDLLFELARGGMGAVYVARLRGAHGFDRLVAVKRLAMHNAKPSDVTAFLDEARVTARISHPNVVQTLELGEHEGAPFLVMHLVQGVSLAHLLARLEERGEKLDNDLAAWVIAQAAAGLHAAHELKGAQGEPLNLVHRDISPHNILLSFDGRVYMADFGVAKFASKTMATQSGIVKGKFSYMSPEQTRATVLDRRSDIFSLGIVLYESLTLRRAFKGDAPAQIVLQIVETMPTSPRAICPEVPEDLEAVAMRCLAKDPERRFATAAEVGDALRKILRARSRPVDETDLATLVDKLFAEERALFDQQIRVSLPPPSSTIPMGEPPVMERAAPTQASQVSMVAVSGAMGVPRPIRMGRVIAGAIVGLAAAGAVVWMVRGTTGSTEKPTSTATPFSTSTSTSISTSTATPTSTPTSTTTATATPTSPSTAPTPRPPPKGARDGRPPAGQHLDAGSSLAPKSPASAAPSSSAGRAGVPFESL